MKDKNIKEKNTKEKSMNRSKNQNDSGKKETVGKKKKKNSRKILISVIISILVVIFFILLIFFIKPFGNINTDYLQSLKFSDIGNINFKLLFGVDCKEFEQSFSIESSCNVDLNEVKVSVSRKSDKINIKKIHFEYQPSDSLWIIDGSKCLDVRLENNDYGNYCSLIREEEERNYVFQLSSGLQDTVKVWIEDEKRVCLIGEGKVKETC